MTRRGTALAGVLAAVIMVGCGGGDGGLRRGLAKVYDFAASRDDARPLAEMSGLDFDQRAGRALVSGWSAPEVSQRTGTTFAWAVATEAVVDLPLIRTHLTELELRCWPFVYEGAPRQRVEVVANGVHLGTLELGPAPAVYSLPVPEGALTIGDNRLVLHFSYAEPADRHGVADSRTLAAAFDFIRPGEPRVPSPPWSSVGSPTSVGGALKVPVGAGLVYTLVAPENAILEVAARSTGAKAWGEVWVRRAEGVETERVAWVTPSHPRRATLRIPLGVKGGDQLQIGFATLGGGAAQDGVTWLRPRLYGIRGEPQRPVNLLLLDVDTLRADFVGAYGGDVPTPNLDALAASGVRFERAYSHIPITGPSHTTIFTSRLPFEHGVHNNAQMVDRRTPLLAEDLRSWGWHTAGFVSLGVLRGRFGFDRGFSVYEDDFEQDWMKNAEEVNDEVLGWLKGGVRRPFFLWVHYSDPHEPYGAPGLDYPQVRLSLEGRTLGTVLADGRMRDIPVTVPPGDHSLRLEPVGPRPEHALRFPAAEVDGTGFELRLGRGWETHEKRFGPDTFDTRLPATLLLRNSASRPREGGIRLACREVLSRAEIRERYGGEVAYVDRQVGVLMEALASHGLLDHTLVVFLSDHGEGLGEHNHVGHISQLYDTLLRVPLVLSMPGRLPAGLVIHDVVGLIDVAPTVAELLRLPAPAGARGRSLLPVIAGEGMVERPLVAETYRPESATDKQAVISGGFKYIHSRRERDWVELYDLRRDPEELENLAGRRPEKVAELVQLLEARFADAVPVQASDAQLTPAETARLRALGYLR